MYRWIKKYLLLNGFVLLALVGVTVCSTVPAQADVTIKQSTKTEGLGGFLNAETETVVRIKGDRKSEDSEVRLSNKLMRLMGGSEPVKTTTITRLDREPAVVWNVNHKSKSYSEEPVLSLADMEPMPPMEGMYDEDSDESDGGMGFDTTGVEYSEPKFSVRKTGKKEKIAGYQSEETVLTVEVEGKTRDTGDKFKLIIDMDLWLAKDVKGIDEFNAFDTKLAKAAGSDVDEGTVESMAAMVAMYGIDPKILGEEAAKLEGYPMRQTIVMKGKGAQFKEQQAKAQGDEGSAASPEEEIAGKMLKGLFGRKKNKKKDKQKGDNDEVQLVKMTTTITDISTGAIPDSRFEPPSGYKKTASNVGQ